MANFCRDCQCWLYVYDSCFEKFGTCDNVLVEGQVVLEKEYDGEIVIHTEEFFGCVHFTPKHGNVITSIDLDDY